MDYAARNQQLLEDICTDSTSIIQPLNHVKASSRDAMVVEKECALEAAEQMSAISNSSYHAMIYQNMTLLSIKRQDDEESFSRQNCIFGGFYGVVCPAWVIARW